VSGDALREAAAVVSDWVRREYTGIGMTQFPPGRYLPVLQQRYGGSVLLCIDVGASPVTRDGGLLTRLQHAVTGAERFVAGALAAHYHVGLVLWHHDIAGHVALTRDPAAVSAALRAAGPGGDKGVGDSGSGGNDISHTLRLGLRELGNRSGDRVLAIFGHGDIGPVAPALELARQAHTMGIRIVVRGLGESAAAALNQIASDRTEPAVVASVEGVAAGITSMVASITAPRRLAQP
jgi:hypothetical protein